MPNHKPDPIGDLFAANKPASVAQVPAPSTPSPSKSKRNETLLWILVALAVVGVYGNKYGLVPNLNPFAQNVFGKPGMRCLVVHESETDGGAPPAINGEVRAYLTTHCVADDKKHPEFRVLDKDTKFAADQAMWKQVMDRGQKQLPWLVIGSDKGNYEGPLPASPQAMLELLKRYGGP